MATKQDNPKTKGSKRVAATKRTLLKGPRGGYYYITDNGNKVYHTKKVAG